jgi:hypothetical protein
VGWVCGVWWVFEGQVGAWDRVRFCWVGWVCRVGTGRAGVGLGRGVERVGCNWWGMWFRGGGRGGCEYVSVELWAGTVREC